MGFCLNKMEGKRAGLIEMGKNKVKKHSKRFARFGLYGIVGNRKQKRSGINPVS